MQISTFQEGTPTTLPGAPGLPSASAGKGKELNGDAASKVSEIGGIRMRYPAALGISTEKGSESLYLPWASLPERPQCDSSLVRGDLVMRDVLLPSSPSTGLRAILMAEPSLVGITDIAQIDLKGPAAEQSVKYGAIFEIWFTAWMDQETRPSLRRPLHTFPYQVHVDPGRFSIRLVS